MSHLEECHPLCRKESQAHARFINKMKDEANFILQVKLLQLAF